MSSASASARDRPRLDPEQNGVSGCVCVACSSSFESIAGLYVERNVAQHCRPSHAASAKASGGWRGVSHAFSCLSVQWLLSSGGHADAAYAVRRRLCRRIPSWVRAQKHARVLRRAAHTKRTRCSLACVLGLVLELPSRSQGDTSRYGCANDVERAVGGAELSRDSVAGLSRDRAANTCTSSCEAAEACLGSLCSDDFRVLRVHELLARVSPVASGVCLRVRA